MIFFYVYQMKKRNVNSIEKKQDNVAKEESSPLARSKVFAWLCFRTGGETDEETSQTSSTDTKEDEQEHQKQKQVQRGGGSLVTLDGETELELETLLKASAYILGAPGSSIVYKAVLQDGSTLAVRRIGESGEERFRDFVNQVKIIAKLRHPNLVRIRGYYWGVDEKLVIYDYVLNGSLANACYKRPGSSPYQLPWEARLRIARGVARGLTYLHEKKHVHGNLKPANILLGPDMEPKIGDFGLERLVLGENSYKGGSARNFGSKRSTMSRDSLQDVITNPSVATPSPSSMSMSGGGASPYQAPESLKNLKPSTKWDVYSFGIVLLELLTGRIFLEHELSQWNTTPGIGVGYGIVVEEKNRVLRMADMAIRPDVEGKEETLVTCFKLGFNCASLVPMKRPTMKEVAQILEKIPSAHSYYYKDHL
ncbi:hypothetical protein GIB67_021935 [Kingdonia uniflora]|uniref:Protein kinase domain-containing protein n=1 Tax=Kingdonia uniflora TaxID=39325 RepID=A0A7J7N4L4_9MAGN|nr:hypothetical protein GIB67_021935 [Kingdonia uniflora]